MSIPKHLARIHLISSLMTFLDHVIKHLVRFFIIKVGAELLIESYLLFFTVIITVLQLRKKNKKNITVLQVDSVLSGDHLGHNSAASTTRPEQFHQTHMLAICRFKDMIWQQISTPNKVPRFETREISQQERSVMRRRQFIYHRYGKCHSILILISVTQSTDSLTCKKQGTAYRYWRTKISSSKIPTHCNHGPKVILAARSMSKKALGI